ncbi:hypothetical protein JHK85_056935 [Glycine max]|nr:hypothetical protein JHK85_056935 [Glycine max]
MSQQVLRPLRQWPWFHHHHHRTCVTLSLHHLLTPPPKTSHRFSFATVAASSRPKVRTPKSPVPPPPTADSDLEEKKSRNQLKREARRTVKWGMDLASFSPPQIKRILRSTSFPFPIYPFAFPQSPLSKVLSFPRHSTTSSPFFWVAGLLPRTIFFSSKLLCWLSVVEDKVYVVLPQRLGPDVREGRRRQFSYIGKLLREVDPELMERLIKATKDSNQKELQALTGLGPDDPEPEDDDDLVESESEEDEEESNWHDNQVARWFDGLISKDIEITNEIYSVQGVEFDRQELRKLVRRVHNTQEMKADNEEEKKKIETATNGAKKALNRFLRGLSKRIPNE